MSLLLSDARRHDSIAEMIESPDSPSKQWGRRRERPQSSSSTSRSPSPQRKMRGRVPPLNKGFLGTHPDIAEMVTARRGSGSASDGGGGRDAASSQLLSRGFLGTHPEIAEMVRDSTSSSGAGPLWGNSLNRKQPLGPIVSRGSGGGGADVADWSLGDQRAQAEVWDMLSSFIVLLLSFPLLLPREGSCHIPSYLLGRTLEMGFI